LVKESKGKDRLRLHPVWETTWAVATVEEVWKGTNFKGKAE